MKLADENNASSDSGGRPCLATGQQRLQKGRSPYFTKSARERVCNGLLARLATSSSAIVVELGGWDHLWAEGDG